MAAAYGVPLGGALFALEVMRGMLALRYVLPALFASVVATAVSWLALPDAPTYLIPAYSSSMSSVVWALLAGPIAGVVSVGYVRAVTWADRNKPQGWRRLVGAVVGTGSAWRGLDPVPAVAWQWQGHLATCVHEPGSAILLLILLVLRACRDHTLHPQRRSWRPVHAFSNGRRTARRSVGACLVLVLARRASRAVRRARRGSGSRGHHARPDLDGGADDGTDWPGPIVYRAAVAGSGYRYSGGADHRAALDL